MKMFEIRWPRGVAPVLADCADTLAKMLAEAVAGELKQALAEQERATLVVSGGSTPVPLFRILSEQPLAWDRVDVVLADERWVAENADASNSALVRRHLLTGMAAAARFHNLRLEAGDIDLGAERAERVLDRLVWPAAVVVLGMGTDGHTASLFPDAPETPAALDPCNPRRVLAVRPPSQPQQRLTLSLRALSGARFTALHLRGDDKLGALGRVFAEPDEIRRMPVRAFVRPGLRVYWSP